MKESFSITAPLESLAIEKEVSLELSKKLRPDLDTYTIDSDTSPEASEFRRSLFDSLSEPSAVVPYTTGVFITSAYFPRSETTVYYGMFHERKLAFEYKPWVESELKRIGVPTVPWRYVRDDDRQRLLDSLQLGKIVVRTSRSDGGAGLDLIGGKKGITEHLPMHSDGFVAVAPYLHPNIPINVNACVYRDGAVSLHSPSLQLIGIPGCTSRRFGYCGNDFARIRDLPAKILDQFEEIVLKTGKWLGSMGYLGAFGVDALVCDSKVYLTEVNPRFQGSSALSAALDDELDRPDVFLSHIAAFQGLSPRPHEHMRDLAERQRRVSQIIFHNCSPFPVKTKEVGMPESSVRYLLTPRADVAVNPNGVLAKAYVGDSVTEDGLQLFGKYRRLTDDNSDFFRNFGPAREV